jgi:hypothetical protein
MIAAVQVVAEHDIDLRGLEQRPGDSEMECRAPFLAGDTGKSINY